MHADTRIQSEDTTLVEGAADVFAMLSDPSRIRIILSLQGSELSVNDLAERVGRPPSAVSQHLAKLRWARVVRTRRDGTRVLYRLSDEHALELVTQAMHQAEHTRESWPAHHRETGLPGTLESGTGR